MSARTICACGWTGSYSTQARAQAMANRHVCKTDDGVRRATRHHRCARCGLEVTYENAGATEARSWFRRHSCAKQEAKMLRATLAADRLALIDRTPKPCLHKEAAHQHGTNACYHLDSCRCDPCAEAARVYQNTRARKIAYGQWNGYVPGEFVRDHIAELQAYGIGPKRIAELSGVPHGAISKIIYGVYAPGPAGRNGRGDLVRGPSRRVRRKTAEAIYAVEPIPTNLGSRVPDPDRTPLARTHLRALVALGWPMSELGRRMGMRHPGNLAKSITGDAPLARGTVDKAEALFTSLCMTVPTPSGGTARARSYAQAQGWRPPLALEDLDDDQDVA